MSATQENLVRYARSLIPHSTWRTLEADPLRNHFSRTVYADGESFPYASDTQLTSSLLFITLKAIANGDLFFTSDFGDIGVGLVPIFTSLFYFVNNDEPSSFGGTFYSTAQCPILAYTIIWPQQHSPEDVSDVKLHVYGYNSLVSPDDRVVFARTDISLRTGSVSQDSCSLAQGDYKFHQAHTDYALSRGALTSNQVESLIPRGSTLSLQRRNRIVERTSSLLQDCLKKQSLPVNLPISNILATE